MQERAQVDQEISFCHKYITVIANYIHRKRPHPNTASSRSALSRPDTLRIPKHFIGIKLPLQLPQPLQIRPIVQPRRRVTIQLRVQVVGVHAPLPVCQARRDALPKPSEEVEPFGRVRAVGVAVGELVEEELVAVGKCCGGGGLFGDGRVGAAEEVEEEVPRFSRRGVFGVGEESVDKGLDLASRESMRQKTSRVERAVLSYCQSRSQSVASSLTLSYGRLWTSGCPSAKCSTLSIQFIVFVFETCALISPKSGRRAAFRPSMLP